MRHYNRHDVGDLLAAIGRVPINLIAVPVGLFFAIGTDRTAAMFALAGVALVFAWGPGPVGVLLATYGILAFFQSVVQAMLR